MLGKEAASPQGKLGKLQQEASSLQEIQFASQELIGLLTHYFERSYVKCILSNYPLRNTRRLNLIYLPFHTWTFRHQMRWKTDKLESACPDCENMVLSAHDDPKFAL